VRVEGQEVFAMIHIKEKTLDRDTIAVEVGGILDQGAIPLLQNVCDRYLREERKVLLDLEGVVHITREGRVFLHEIHKKVTISNLPEFVKLEPPT
jgi:hypothetical protein